MSLETPHLQTQSKIIPSPLPMVVLLTLFYFTILLIAAYFVGEGGDVLGDKYGASVVGGLIIAWINTAPEVLFCLTALQSNNPEFAIGAMSGSVITVNTIALGLCIYIGSQNNPATQSFQIIKGVQTQCFILLSSLSLIVTTLIIGFSLFIGVLGIFCYGLFIYYSVKNPIEHTHTVHDHVDSSVSKSSSQTTTVDIETGVVDGSGIASRVRSELFKEPVSDQNPVVSPQVDPDDSDSDDEEPTDEQVRKAIFHLIIGAALIWLASGPFIESVDSLAKSWSIGASILAFFLGPIASEAPEILESINLSRKSVRSTNLAISSLVGGTVSKTTLLFGIFCIFGVVKEYPWLSDIYPAQLGLVCLACVATGALGVLTQLDKTYALALFGVYGFSALTTVLG